MNAISCFRGATIPRFDGKWQKCIPAGILGVAMLGWGASLNAGGIEGTVSSGSVGIEAVDVKVFNKDNPAVPVAAVTTTTGGAYSFAGLLAGEYRVRFDGTTAGYGSEWFDGVPYFDLASVVVVGAGTTGSIDAELDAVGKISGQVTDGGGDGIGNIIVRAMIVHNQWWREEAARGVTGADGNYVVSGLNVGSYSMEFVAVATSYMSAEFASPVNLDLGQHVADVDAVLVTGGVIRGTVLDGNAQPLAGVLIQAAVGSVEDAVSVTSGTDGTYFYGGLAPGDYLVKFNGAPVGHAMEFFDGTGSFNDATKLSVTPGVEVVDVDASLGRVSAISGRVTNVSGSGLAGIQVSVYQPGVSWPYSSVSTGPDGHYFVTGIGEEAYDVRFEDRSGIFVAEWFDGVAAREDATPVAVLSSQNTGNIDASLALAAPASNVVWGRAASASGMGAANAWIELSGVQGYSTSANADGWFIFRGVEPGVGYSLNVSPQWGSPLLWTSVNGIDFSAGGVLRQDVVVPLGGSVTGRLVDVEGNPVEGNVRLYDSLSEWGSVAWGEAGADGFFTVWGIPGGDYKLSVQSFGGEFRSQWFNGKVDFASADIFSVLLGETVDVANIVMVAGPAIIGTVTHALTGAPVVGAQVNHYDAQGNFSWNWSSTDADGIYRIRNLEPGAYRIRVSAEGFYPAFYDGRQDLASADVVTLGGNADVTGIDFALVPGARITGTVTDSLGNPLQGVSVAVHRAYDSWNALRSGMTDADGKYSIPVLSTEATQFKVKFTKGGYVVQWFDAAAGFSSASLVPVVPLADGASDVISGVDAVLAEAGGMSGRVVDHVTGAAVPGVQVYVYATGGFSVVADKVTDITGSFVIDTLADGSYQVRFVVTGRPEVWFGGASSQAQAQSVSVVAGQVEALADTRMRAYGSVTGRIAEADSGVGIGNALAYIYAEGAPGYLAYAWSDANGNFTISNVISGADYQVRFTCPGYAEQWFNGKPNRDAADPVDVVDGQATTSINAAMYSRGTIAGTVTDVWSGGILANATVKLYNAAGTEIDSRTSNSNGYYQFTNLEAASYKVGFERAGFVSQWHNTKADLASADSIAVSGTATQTVNAALVNVGRIAGRVTAVDSGTGLQGISVAAYTMGGAFVTSISSASDGSYLLSGLTPGNYAVGFWPNFGPYLSQYYDGVADLASATPVNVAAVGSVVQAIDASLQRGATITGSVVDGDTGISIPYANVNLYRVDGSVETYLRWVGANASGEYQIQGITAGNYRLKFSQTGYLAHTSTDFALAGASSMTVNASLYLGSSISGTVTQSDGGAALESVHVALWSGASQLSSDWTDANGAFEFVGIVSGNYQVRFSTVDYFTQWFDGAADQVSATTIALLPPSARSDINAAMVRGGVVTGRIVDSVSGAGVGAVYVELMDGADQIAGSTTTGSDGTFRFSPVMAGDYIVSAEKSGYAKTWYNGRVLVADADAVSVAPGSTTQLGDLAMIPHGAIGGTITDSGCVPLVGAWVGVYRSDQSYAGSVNTGADGTYQVGSLPSGSYKVMASKDGGYLTEWYSGKGDFASADTVDVVAPLVTQDIEITLVTGASIAGTVTGLETDGSSAPISGASISVSSAAAPGATLSWASTDATGGYSFVGLGAGDYVVHASGAGFLARWLGGISVSEATVITVVPPDAITGADLVLPRPASLTGRVVDSAGGAAIEGVLVNIYFAQGNSVVSSTTDALGTFTFMDLDTSEVKLRFAATDQGYFLQFFDGKTDLNSADAVVLEAPLVKDIGDIMLVQAGTIAGSVRDAVGNPIQNASVTVTAHPGNQWVNTVSTVSTVSTDAAGVFTARGLVAGDYKLSASANGFLSVVYDGVVLPVDGTPVSVSNGVIAAGIDFTLPLPAGISGTVTGDGGNPVEGMSVFLLNASKSLIGSTNTNVDGLFAFHNMWAGTYFIQYQGQASGYLQRWFDGRGSVDAADPITLSPGDAFVADVAMMRPGGVTGIVRSKGTGYTGENPMANVTVSLHRASDNSQVASTSSGPDGAFMLSSTQVATGEYVVRFQATQVGFFNQWYPGKPSLAEAESIAIVEGQMVSGIDGWLMRPRITVVATGEGTATPAVQELPYNSTATIELAPAAGWSPLRFVDTVWPGVSIAPSSYELSRPNVTQNREIEVVFEAVSDLVVTDIQMPGEAFNGEPVAVSWTLTNHGAADAAGPWYDRVSMSPDGQLGSDTYLVDFSFTGAIAAGQSITRTQMVTIPKAINAEADFYLVVQTDIHKHLREGHTWEVGEQNNAAISADPLRVRISPAADLVVASVTAPASAFSGQDALFSWTVQNTGNGGTDATVWYDRLYLSLDDQFDSADVELGNLRNASFLPSGESYASQMTVKLPNGIGGQYYLIARTDVYKNTSESDKSNNTRAAVFSITLTPPPDLQVTAITAPPNAFSGQPAPLSWIVTNLGSGPSVTVNWSDSVYLSENDDPSITQGDKLLGNFARSGALEPGGSYTQSRAVNMPPGVSGQRFYKVRTDTWNQVFEHTFSENNIRASQPATNVILQGPDLEVIAMNVTSPLPLEAGHPISLSWKVENFGTAVVPNYWWNDSVYLSESAIFDPATAVKLGDRTRYGAIGVGATYDATGSFVVPNGITGTRYLFVVTNSNNVVVELDNGNNISNALAVSVVFNPADLATTDVIGIGNAITGGAINLSWTVTNEGTGKTVSAAWTDRVYLTSDPGLQSGLQILASFNRSGALAAGEEYSRTEIVTLPHLIQSGTYYLAVMADLNNAAAEGETRENNLAAHEIQITQLLSDLTPTALDAPSTVASGSDLALTWTVANQGQAGTNYHYWYERIYLSPTADPADPDKVLIGTHYRTPGLSAGSDYSFSRGFTVPRTLEGLFFLGIEADGFSYVVDADRSNNLRWSASPIEVTLTPAPDLAVENVVVASSAFSGRPLQVTWTVRNLDADTESGAKWDDSVYLSRDKFFDASDTQIGWLSRVGGLGAGDSYTQSGDFTIPLGMSGPLYVFVVSDRADHVFEDSRNNNNTAYKVDPVIISLPEPSDLRVRSIVSPVVAVLGGPISVTYKIENVGANPAPGGWSDAIYLSSEAGWNAEAVLLGRVFRTQSLASGAFFEGTLQATVPGLMPGDYYVLVRSDVFNNVLESEETNNLAASDNPVAIDAPLLVLNEAANFNLAARQSSYYRLEIDSAGEALLVSLAATSSSAYNELYIAYGRVPTRGDFDFAFSRPYFASQDVVVPVTRAGTYYILAYANHTSGANPVELLAEVIPFSIRSIDPVAGGDTGNLTLKILGARFSLDTTFALLPDFAGGQRVEATRVYYLDSGVAFATFNLAGAALGSYQVEARDPAFPVDTLEDALDLHVGSGARLEANVSGHSAVRPGREYIFHVNYGNIGDADAIPPILIVRTTTETPFGPSLSDLGTGPRQFLAGSPGGVSGILRPGELYSVPFYFRSDTEQINFTVQVLGADDEREIDWDGLEASVRPEGMDELAWDDLWERVRDRIGTTWGDYVRTLSDIASLLGWRGESTYDLSLLWEELFAQAGGYPTAQISGTLVHAETGETLSGINMTAVLADIDEAGGIVNASVRESITDGAGRFLFLNVEEGEHLLGAHAYQVVGPPRVSVGPGNDVHGLVVRARPVPPPVDWSDIEDSDVLPTPVVDSAGVSHMVWLRGGDIWHAWYDGSEWVDARAITDTANRDTGVIDSLSVGASATLLDSSAPAILVTWRAGAGNASALMHAVGRALAGGGYEWSIPAPMTDAPQADRNPALVITPSGRALVTFQRYIEGEAAIGQIPPYDDPDLYFGLYDLYADELEWQAPAPSGVTSLSGPVSMSTSLVDALDFSTSFSYDISARTGSVPGWIPVIGGKEAKYKMTLSGAASQGCEDLRATMEATGEMSVFDKLNFKLTGGGNILYKSNVETGGCPNPEYRFAAATLHLGVSVEAFIPAWIFEVPGDGWIADKYVKAQIGPVVGVSLSGMGGWTGGAFPGLPNTGEINLTLSLGGKGEAEIFDGTAKGTVSLIGSASFELVELKALGTALALSFELEVGNRRQNFAKTWSWNAPAAGWFSSSDSGTAPFNGGAISFGLPDFRTFGSGGETVEIIDDESGITTITTYPTVTSFGPPVGTGGIYASSGDEPMDIAAVLGAGVGSSIYRDGPPSLSRSATGALMLAWKKDLPPTALQSGQQILVSLFNEGTGQWSMPAEIPGAVGFVGEVVGLHSGNSPMVLWTASDSTGIDDTTPTEVVMSRLETRAIWCSVLSGSVWSAPAQVIGTGLNTRLEAGVAHDGRVLAAWMRNNSATEGQRDLMVAWWDGSTWSSPAAVFTGALEGIPSVLAETAATSLFWEWNVASVGETPSLRIGSHVFASGSWSGPVAFAPDEPVGAMTSFATSSTTLVSGHGLSFPPPVPADCCPPKPTPTPRPSPTPPPESTPKPPKPGPYNPPVVRSMDPNDILGPEGFGPERWIRSDKSMFYTIRFENDPEWATAPAQEVIITMTLDPDLDPRSFRVGGFGWAAHHFDPAESKAFYSARLDQRDEHGYFVDVFAFIDTSTGEARWTITTIDPDTGQKPLDGSVGFLMPNDEDGIGEGYVTFTASPRRNLASGAVVDAEARIIFDTEAPIDTPRIFNTLDTASSSSHVLALPSRVPEAEFLVSWTGEDNEGGSGLAYFDIYVAENDGPFVPWLKQTTLKQAPFIGVIGSSYAFYSIATDNTGFAEIKPEDAEASTICGIEIFTLSYTASAGGSIVGDSEQSVQTGADGASVHAVASEGFVFYQWSDGRTDNPRTETNVQESLSVSALFDPEGSAGGIATGWYRGYGLGPAEGTLWSIEEWNALDHADADGDGADNSAEFIAGTHPLDPASVLRIGSMLRSSDGSVTLRWPSVAGRVYFLDSCLDLQEWTEGQTPMPATPPVNEHQILAPADTRHFWRVRVQIE